MKKVLKFMAMILATLSVIVVSGMVFLHYSFKGMCGNEIFHTIQSPNKEFKVVIFQRDCGATTGFSTQVSILKTKKELSNESGNIFVANGHPEENKITLTWLNDNTIEISENISEPFLRKNSFQNIDIVYKN